MTDARFIAQDTLYIIERTIAQLNARAEMLRLILHREEPCSEPEAKSANS